MTGVQAARLLRAVLSPQVLARDVIRRFSIGSVDFRLAMQALNRPEYAFGVKYAAQLAARLKLPKISVIEFGVATGGGLLALESYAAEYGRLAGVDVEVYGFDTGVGLPEVSDYRDLGYVWRRGAYRMDVEGLKRRLRKAQLVLGDIRDTLPEFLKADHAPIGFISFDLDYFRSTKDAFGIFGGADSCYLPRVLCYFDDIISDGIALHCDDVGELRAIREFNRNAKEGERLAQVDLIFGEVLYPAPWLRQLWTYHRFHHPHYNTYVGLG